MTVYEGAHSDGRAWFTRGDGSLLHTQTILPRHPNSRGLIERGQFGSPSPYGSYVHNGSSMHVDEEYTDYAQGEGSNLNESRQTFQRASGPTATGTASNGANGSTHTPSPLYAQYYSSAADVPQDQIEVFSGAEFLDQLPEDPPPFEVCYAPGEVPKQFVPKSKQ